MTASADAALVERMAEAAYEASRPIDSVRPPWPRTLDTWQAACRRDMAAAILAAERAGYRISKPRPRERAA